MINSIFGDCLQQMARDSPLNSSFFIAVIFQCTAVAVLRRTGTLTKEVKATQTNKMGTLPGEWTTIFLSPFPIRVNL